MDIRTLGVWASFAVQIASGAATVNPDYQWVAVPIFWSATMLLLICVCLWLYSNRKQIFRWAERVEPSYVIFLGLAIALGGAIWWVRSPPPMDPRVTQLQSQIANLTKESADRHAATVSELSTTKKSLEEKTHELEAAKKRNTVPTAATAETPPRITTATADIPKKLAAIDDLRRILNEEMLPWINKGEQLSTGGWWNWYVGDQITEMQDAARSFFVKSQELDQEIQRLQNANVQFPDIHALASSPLGRPFLLRIQNLVTPILALPHDPSKKMGNELYRFLFEPYAKETYAALSDIQSWRGATDRNAIQLRQRLSQ